MQKMNSKDRCVPLQTLIRELDITGSRPDVELPHSTWMILEKCCEFSLRKQSPGKNVSFKLRRDLTQETKKYIINILQDFMEASEEYDRRLLKNGKDLSKYHNFFIDNKEFTFKEITVAFDDLNKDAICRIIHYGILETDLDNNDYNTILDERKGNIRVTITYDKLTGGYHFVRSENFSVTNIYFDGPEDMSFEEILRSVQNEVARRSRKKKVINALIVGDF